LGYNILLKDPDFINRLLDLGLTGAGAEQSKRILNSAVTFLMIAVRNGDSSHFDKVIDCTEKEIMGAIDKNLKSARDMKKIHYRVLLMLILSSGI